MVQKLGRTKTFLKVGKVCDKDDILTVQEKIVALIDNKTNRRLEMNPRQRELEARWLKVSKMCIKKLIK